MTTEETTNFIFASLEASQVTIKAFALLSTISRTTIQNWKRGDNITDRLRLGVAYSVAIRLDRAVKAGRLPLSSEVRKPAEKLAALKRIVNEMGG